MILAKTGMLMFLGCLWVLLFVGWGHAFYMAENFGELMAYGFFCLMGTSLLTGLTGAFINLFSE